MVENRRFYLDIHVNSRPVLKFKGKKTYISTGDSDDISGAESVSFYSRPSRANVQPSVGDVIFAKMANTDKTMLIDENLAEYIFSTGFFDVSSERIDNKFLYYIIKSHKFDSLKNAFSEGTTQVSISDQRLKKIKLEYETSLEKQAKISSFLDSQVAKIDEILLGIDKQIELLEAYKISFFKELVFKDKNEYALIIEKIMKGEYSSSLPRMKYYFNVILGKMVQPVPKSKSDELLPYLCANNVKQGFLDLDYVKKMWFAKDEKSKYIVKSGDLLVVEGGSVGNSCIYDGDDILIQNALHCVKSSRPMNLYLHYWIRLLAFNNYFERICNKATIAHFTKEKLEAMPIFIDFNLYQEQVKTVENKWKEIDLMIELKKTKKEKLISFKNSLIFEFVSGLKEVPHEFE